MLKILLLSLSRQYTVDGQCIPSLFIEPEVRHDKTSYNRRHLIISVFYLTLKAPITTAADDKYRDNFPKF